MSMLLALDHSLFSAINGAQGSPFFDAFFLRVTDLGTFIGYGVALIAYVLHTRVRHWRKLSLAIAAAVAAGLVSTAIKFAVARPRPPLVLANVHVLGPELTFNSFPSGHTVSAFAVLAILLIFDRPLGWAWLPLAVLVAVSRVYLGVHFPSDVLFGAALGFFGVYPVARQIWARPL